MAFFFHLNDPSVCDYYHYSCGVNTNTKQRRPKSSPEHSPPVTAPCVRQTQALFLKPQSCCWTSAPFLLVSSPGCYLCPFHFPWPLANEGFCRRVEPNGVAWILQTKLHSAPSCALELLCSLSRMVHELTECSRDLSEGAL